jgi:serine/threonine-protein kinase
MNLGGFLIEKQLGVGGMGEVWLAKQEKLNRHVAVKILSPKYTSNATFVERFMCEVRNSAKLEHPNIVTAFHAGVENGIYFLAISYVSGNTVFDRICDGTSLSEKESLEIARAVAEALDYAWNEFKILHRDIKPSNIMVDKKGAIKLMDMGISKSLEEESSLTMMGTMIGTPYYVSPEQAIGARDIDFRADIYSLGATLYHMLTGTVPYDASTAMAIISKHISEALPDPRNYNSTLNDQTVSLIKTMMAKDKNDRQRSWRILVNDIDRVINGEYPLSPVPDANKTTIANMSSDNTPRPIELEPSIEKPAPEISPDSPSAQNTDTATETKSGSSQAFKIVIILLVVFFFMAIFTSLLGFFAYKYWKSGRERGSILPTEIISKTPRPKSKTAVMEQTISAPQEKKFPEKTLPPVKETEKAEAKKDLIVENKSSAKTLPANSPPPEDEINDEKAENDRKTPNW